MSQKIRSSDGLLRSVPDPGQVAYVLIAFFFSQILIVLSDCPFFRLPKDGEQNVLITSALPYCNNVPHLGIVFEYSV